MTQAEPGMPGTAPRVVLLARAGGACDRVRMGLVEAGADLVLEADPGTLEPQQLRDLRPQVAVVVLDVFTEPAFDRLEQVFADLGTEVMLEEAEVAAAREGWDAARWVRHLAAKLHRHGNVLPPGADPGPERSDAPGVDTTRQAGPASSGHAASAVDTAVAGDALVWTLDLASDGSGPVADDASTWRAVDALPAGTTSAETVVGVDDGPLDGLLPAHPLSDDFTPGVDAGDYLSFDPVAAEMDHAAHDADQIVGFDFVLHDEFAAPADAAQGAASAEGTGFAAELVFGSDLAAMDTYGIAGEPLPADPIGAGTDAVAEPAPGHPGGHPPTGGFGDLALVLDDEPIASAPAADSRFARDLGELERRIASLELVDTAALEAEAARRAGAVVILAGIGGPDAVRQLLGALPTEFPHPVLVQQRLDGARYDRLVAQMRRASSMPVELAGEGDDVRAGVAYIVPAGIGVTAVGGVLRFDGSGDLLDALAPADSAVVLLSGTEFADVERLAGPAWERALLAAQASEGCYDATAPVALAERGAVTGQPVELARCLAERWSAS